MMTQHDVDFRQSLLDAESFDPARQRKFQSEIQAMWDEHTRLSKRTIIQIVAKLWMIAGIGFGLAALLVPSDFPLPARMGFLAASIVLIVGSGLVLVRAVIEQSELRTRERLLEVEYRLEQLSDELKRRTGGDDEFEPARI